MKDLSIRTLALIGAAWAACPVLADDLPPPVDQAALNDLVAQDPAAAFAFAFEAGDELTETSFDAARGVGAQIGEGRRFTRFPRADLTGPGEWATHVPRREGGANATSCIACHNAPLANGAGDVALNAIVDPGHTGDPSLYLERNTLPLFALGIPQRLAEEISTTLYAQRDAGIERACATGAASVDLAAKGVDYGRLQITRTAQSPCVTEQDASGLSGIDADLVIRAFGWKGTSPTIRDFTRGAAHNELGLQGVELVGLMDGDHDGVTGELTVGDMTALTIYMAALERPVSTVELAAHGLAEMSDAEAAQIAVGETRFGQIGCASCHTPSMVLDDPVFREPSTVAGFYDEAFPSGAAPASLALLPGSAIAFDLTADQPNNQFDTGHLGAMEVTADGATARWFTDFKRHDMGAALADPDDPLGLGAAMFLTRSLAGVESTGPWLHDGRATSLDEAIRWHGGEAEAARLAYAALAEADREAVLAFLDSLVIYAGHGDDH